MSILKLPYIFILFIFFSPFSYAQTSQIYEQCLTNSDGVTVNIVNCIDDEIKRQDILLNRFYKSYMQTASKQESKALKEAQIAWLKWRDAETKFAYLGEGTITTIVGANRFLEITVKRVEFLSNLNGIDLNKNTKK